MFENLRSRKFCRIAIEIMRFALALVFLWFGLLKLFNVSPVLDVIAISFPTIAENQILYLLLAILEIAIGIGIFLPRIQRFFLWVLIGHLLAATIGVLTSGYAFASNFPLLTFTGEFVIKNIVLMAAALVLISYDRKFYLDESA